MSRATLWGILEVQEASQRKSPKGLDNTVADGVDGFEALHKILDQLEEVGANKEWCAQTCTRLKEAKLYLKRTQLQSGRPVSRPLYWIHPERSR